MTTQVQNITTIPFISAAYSKAEVAQLLNISEDDVQARICKNEILGDTYKGTQFFPKFQFNNNTSHPYMKPLLETLNSKGYSSRMVCSFFARPLHSALNNIPLTNPATSPASLIEQGIVQQTVLDDLLSVARVFGTQDPY